MFRPLRTLISLTMLAGMVWFAFAVELGDKTFAQHVDHISDTPEAQQLIEGTRATINPKIDDVRDRMFGEYVEAPTYLSGEAPDEPRGARERDDVVPASTLRSHETDESLFEREPARPGRRRSVYAREEELDAVADEEIAEPERPGRRRRPAAIMPPTPEPPTSEPTSRARWLPGALVHDVSPPEVEARPSEPEFESDRVDHEPERPGRGRAPASESPPASRPSLHDQVPDFLVPAPPPSVDELPRFMQPAPPPRPVVLHDLPLPRATIDDRHAAARMLELVERMRVSLPPKAPTPPSRATIPIVQPTFDPTLPELPSE